MEDLNNSPFYRMVHSEISDNLHKQIESTLSPDRWEYSELEVLYQELNNLTYRRTCDRNYHSGLTFKTISNYLTLAGLNSGEAGWYMAICWDNYRIVVADRHPENVLKKAIYWFTEMMKRKPTDRKITESFMAGDEWKTITSENNFMPTAKD